MADAAGPWCHAVGLVMVPMSDADSRSLGCDKMPIPVLRVVSSRVTFAKRDVQRAVAREVMRTLGRQAARQWLAQQGEAQTTP